MPKLATRPHPTRALTVDDAPSFAARLKELREKAGLSQYELAKRAGLSRQAISHIEAGNREPGWNTVLKLAQALGVNVLAFTDEPPEGVADQGDDEPGEDEPPAPKRRPKK